MNARTILQVVALACGLALSTTVDAQKLYAANVRTPVGGVGEGIPGSLYTVDLGTGTATFVAPMRVDGTTPIGITGAALHPQTGAFYGITAARSPGHPQSLVTIDPATGDARVIGSLGHAGSDIAFSRAGILYTWIFASRQLGSVNITTGAVTPIGSPAPAGGPPAGLAVSSTGVAYVTPRGASGTLDIVDVATGTVRPGPQLSGAPFPTAINSMTFTPSGLLLAVNSNAGNPSNTRLVTINTATGAISVIGTLPDDIDALAFAQVEGRGDTERQRPSWQTIAQFALAFVALILGVVGFLVGRKR